MPELGQVYKQVLTGAVGHDAAVFDYGDIQDFSRVWGTDGDGVPTVLPDVNGKQAIIIVWDGRERQHYESEGGLIDDPGALLLAPHLTPIDWALALSIKVLNGSLLSEDRNFSIHIVDLTGNPHDEWAFHMRFQLLVEMPWLSLHAPLLPNGKGKVADYRKGFQPILGLEGLIAPNGEGWNLAKGAPIGDYKEIRYQDRLKYISRQWSASLTVSNTHHDIHNLIGPSVISGVESKPSKSPSICALYRKMLWTGFLDGELPKKESSDALGEQLSAVGPLDILAIDDEMHRGWYIVLQDLLGIDAGPTVVADDVQWTELGVQGDIELFGCRYPSILDLLPDEANQPFTCRTFNSHPYPAEEGDPRPWMLVLDLRLHSGVKEVEWFSQLLDIAKGIAGADQDSLAWPGFELQDEIDVVEDWLDKGAKREESAYDIALSLFPRLCALRWPAVPILIFSGTGRRALISMLSVYGNLFLVAQKPNVLGGDAGGQIKAFRASFHHELQKAMRFIAIQKSLIALETSNSTATTAGAGYGMPGTQQSKHRHLTIAFEESGDFKMENYSAIGGVVVEVGGCSLDDAQLQSMKFFEALREAGVNFYDHVPAYTDINKIGTFRRNCIAKDKNVAAKVCAVLQQHPHSKIGAFRCLVDSKQYQATGVAYTDGTYLEWLGATVEILLAEYLPSLGYDTNDTTLSIWFPTRSVPRVTAFEAMRYDFNYNAMIGGVAETIGGFSVAYAILTKALAGRACFATVFNAIRGLKSRKIPYWKTKKGLVPARDWYCVECSAFAGIPQNSAARWVDNAEVAFSSMPKQHRECKRHTGKYLAADYSVAQHLADAVLTNSEAEGTFPHDELGQCNVVPSLSFDVNAGERLSDFLQAARLFECGREADAFKLSYKHAFFLGGMQRSRKEGSKDGDFAKAPIEQRLVGRISQFARHVNGNTLIDLAGLTMHLPVHVGSLNVGDTGSQDMSVKSASSGLPPNTTGAGTYLLIQCTVNFMHGIDTAVVARVRAILGLHSIKPSNVGPPGNKQLYSQRIRSLIGKNLQSTVSGELAAVDSDGTLFRVSFNPVTHQLADSVS